MRKIVSVPKLLVIALFLVAASVACFWVTKDDTAAYGCSPLREASTYSQSEQSVAPTDELVILAGFVDDSLDGLGLTREQVRDKIESDLRAEFGDAFEIKVVISDPWWMSEFRREMQQLANDFDIISLCQNATRLTAAAESSEPSESAVEAANEAIREYLTAEADFRRAVENGDNLVGLPPNVIAIFFSPAPGYGGKTVNGEQWSLINTGLAEGDFDRNPQVSLQYMANVAKTQIGRQFGLISLDRTAPLTDAMRDEVDRTAGEHLIRDAHPVAFNETDHELLIQRLSERLQRAAADPGNAASENNDQSVPSSPATSRDSRQSHSFSPFRPPVAKAAQVNQTGNILSTVADGSGIVGGVFSIGEWLVNDISGNSSAKITKPHESFQLDVELGVTFRIDYAVDFRSDDRYFGTDHNFLEIYIIQNSDVLHYERYPESGYISNPANYFDDSISKEIHGTYYLGAKHATEEIDTIKIVATVWNGSPFRELPQLPNLDLDDAVNEDGSVKWYPESQTIFIEGDHDLRYPCTRGMQQRGKCYTGMVRRIAEDVKEIKINVQNTYYVETTSMPYEAEKTHGESFDFMFDVYMNYTQTYPPFVSFPEPPVAAIIAYPPAEEDGWEHEFIATGDGNAPGQVTVIPKEQASSRGTIHLRYRHVGAHEPPSPRIATFEGAVPVWAEGKNRIWYTVNNRQVPHEYDWSALLRAGPNVNEPAQLALSLRDVEQGEWVGTVSMEREEYTWATARFQENESSLKEGWIWEVELEPIESSLMDSQLGVSRFMSTKGSLSIFSDFVWIARTTDPSTNCGEELFITTSRGVDEKIALPSESNWIELELREGEWIITVFGKVNLEQEYEGTNHGCVSDTRYETIREIYCIDIESGDFVYFSHDSDNEDMKCTEYPYTIRGDLSDGNLIRYSDVKQCPLPGHFLADVGSCQQIITVDLRRLEP